MHAHFLSSDPLLPFRRRPQFLGLNNSPHPLTLLSCQLLSQPELMGTNRHSSALNFTPLSKTVCAQTRYTVIYVALRRPHNACLVESARTSASFDIHLCVAGWWNPVEWCGFCPLTCHLQSPGSAWLHLMVHSSPCEGLSSPVTSLGAIGSCAPLSR